MRKNNKVKRKSTAVQVDEEWQSSEPEEEPSWSEPVNIESHLPSHTIHRKTSPLPDLAFEEDEEETGEVEDIDNECDDEPVPQVTSCSEKVCDTSPLDNLLAVAELEFNQHLKEEAWKVSCQSIEESKEDQQRIMEFGSSNEVDAINDINVSFNSGDEKDDCDYNDDDDNNIAMDDILNRLEQSLQSPDTIGGNVVEPEAAVEDSDDAKVPDSLTSVPEVEEEKSKEEEPDELPTDLTVEFSNNNDVPTDLTTKKDECLTIQVPDDDLLPTDLTMPRHKSHSPAFTSPRPSSRGSEAIQSPQPSGLPAVPPSPDNFSSGKMLSKSLYLESLLSKSSEVTTTDVGKCRKSASPTITCSEEVKSRQTYIDAEPEIKKPRLEDITLRNILERKAADEEDKISKENVTKSRVPETSRLLELLTSEISEQDAITQLHQLQADPNLSLPDPMLVPKDRLSEILLNPGKEIPNLLSQRPELRLPEALSYPHLLQDPDILVITLSQLETIIRKQSQSLLGDSNKAPGEPHAKKESVTERSKIAPEAAPKPEKQQNKTPPKDMQSKMHSDMSIANNAAMSHMMLLPYLHQLEMAAMAFGSNGADVFKMLSGAVPPLGNQISDFHQMFGSAATNFQTQPPNPFEVPMWHEGLMHQNLLRSKNQFDYQYYPKNPYREFMEKNAAMNGSKRHHQQQHASSHKPPASKSQQYPTSMFTGSNGQYSLMGMHPSFSSRHNLQVPQYNPSMSQKTHNPYKSSSSSFKDKSAISSSYHQDQLGSLALCHKSKANVSSCSAGATRKPETTVRANKSNPETGVQPIDLSGPKMDKSKFGRHAMADSGSSAGGKFGKFEDIPEVGSTTASIEDMTAQMQESQKQLWHPLFGK